VREPNDREVMRAREIARAAAGRISSGTGKSEDVVLEALTAEVLETALRTYDDDGWVDAGVEPTINLQLLLERLR
jgi:hypothetical protein